MTSLFRTDFHVHTNLSDCGAPEATPKAMLAAARAAGLEAIGFSDHVYYPDHFTRPALLRKRLPSRTGDLRVYVGCETDVISPTEIAIDANYALTLDFVLISGSHLYTPRTNHPIRGMTPEAMAAYLLQTMNVAVASGLADVVVHPFCVPVGLYSFEELVSVADPDGVSRLGEAAARAGVAIEYNPRELKRAPEAAHWLYTRLLDTGVKLAINSDSHRPDGVGCRGVEHATEAQMRAEGVTEDRVWRLEDRVSAGRRGLPI